MGKITVRDNEKSLGSKRSF